MTNYDIFDEQYYLSQYPWLKPALDAGIIKSGREHFEKFGQAGGLTAVSRYFDEQTYLAQNPDIVPSIRNSSNPNAPFASGLDHFIQFGYEEGRTRVSPDYDEAFYVANNRDLLPFIQNGTFKNGYQHFIKFGIKDGLFATSFSEPDYFTGDIRSLVNSGVFKTGREHYLKLGQFDPNRTATFVGTSGNDIVTGFGAGNTRLIGVEVGRSVPNVLTSGIFTVYESKGDNEFDTLIGGTGQDEFLLGTTTPMGIRSALVNIEVFYNGPGFATIQNFTQGQDSIRLGGYLDWYILSPINNNLDLQIQTKFSDSSSGAIVLDTIAVIKGGGNLNLNRLPESLNSFSYFLLG
ncbi:MAG: calcium-binding protein [Microcoleus sp. PH2017_29_MFU_D_A]|uniref:calcium-binding protein n=1 Tax=unclassified Microcoleus TaxID=2642155 RepID=UPI001DF1E198|nr:MULTISPECIES: calcium-binding protein [unclassified Microcoleus]MCC3432375.1 calcium-binding protein [Microcoleus sp. PH2017_04_SCI_O_A]MCC3513397.1 calcium-binding protein [Microcoleus sp. PH2017_17_BER_D_A]TAE53181.1 MAG: calcium-binding protein [Oscillatoriales cyanobacterium]MCC3410457.1 calcium-binding protein [Microcoleus sp. PH2017_02_FOX_O_A]MCC3425695.1 calcium-binding protein [Microcoleus sp. PH2017_01_SCD_O_A]